MFFIFEKSFLVNSALQLESVHLIEKGCDYFYQYSGNTKIIERGFFFKHSMNGIKLTLLFNSFPKFTIIIYRRVITTDIHSWKIENWK